MRDPHELYEVIDELPELDQPVLIQAMSGFVDAGSAGKLARDHLLGVPADAPAEPDEPPLGELPLGEPPIGAPPAEPVTGAGSEGPEPQILVRFDVDELLDYRSRRPTMLFVEDHWESYEEQTLAVYLLHDDAGTPYLLLAGPEPDLQWDRFIAAVIGLIERLGVRLTVGMNAIPMAVPHTRPIGTTAHATRPELVADHQPWLQRVQVPASAGNLLEFRLGQHGRDALGFAAHVPHYLASNDYPAAAEVLLSEVSRVTGLALPTDELRKAAEALRVTVDEQVEKSEEVASHVRGLEEQYDALMQSRQNTNLLADPSSLPTADELAAELERFLAEQAKPGDPPS